jgi:hypothetical protein
MGATTHALARDASRLLEWESYAGAPIEGAARALEHPRFAEAARALAANMLDVLGRDAALAEICKDAGRYVAAMAAIHLHLSGELTLPKLKTACIASGFLGPGRARAVLRVLQDLAYLEPAESSGRVRRYAPTTRFTASWREHLRAARDAARVIEPAGAIIRDALGRPAVATAFMRLQGEGLLRGSRQGGEGPAFVRTVLHRHAGSQIAWLLLAAGDDGFPPRAAARLSIAAVARRFGVSRVHVRRLLRGAARAGVVELGADGATRFADAALPDIRFLYAAQLAQLLASAAGAARATGALDAFVAIDQECPPAAATARPVS